MKYDFVQLGDACEFLDSRRVPVKDSDRKPGPYPYFGANGQQGWIDNYLFDEPLVLLAEDGGSFGSKTKPIAYKVEGKYWVNNHAHVLRPRGNCDIDYLHRVLSYYDVSKYINGTTRQKLTKGNAEDIPVPLPPLIEQRRLAALLDKADRLRRLRRYALELSETYLQSVFLEMFGEYLQPTDKTLKDVLVMPLQNGVFEINEKYSNKGLPVIWVDDLYHTISVDTSNLRRLKTDDKTFRKYEVVKGDLLFTRSSLVREGVGQINIVPPLSERTAFECHIIRARVDSNLANPYYLLELYRSAFGRRVIMRTAKTATMTTIGQEDISELPCPIPPVRAQEKFAHIVRKFERLRAQQREALRQAEMLFGALLKRAFEGEV